MSRYPLPATERCGNTNTKKQNNSKTTINMKMTLLSVFSSLSEFQILFLISWFNNTKMDIIETAYIKYGEKRCRLKYMRTAYNRAAKTYPIPKLTKSVVVEFLK